MQYDKCHNKIGKHLLIVWFAIFALSPCGVKESMFSMINAEYAKPLNKTKTTASSCQYAQGDQVSIAKQSKINKETKPVEVTKSLLYVFQDIALNTFNPQTTSGNSPPKYILFKRLKLHVA
jgi:hypothetical protein